MPFNTQYPALSEDEQARRLDNATPFHERLRLYGRDLLATAAAYAVAADAKGLRKDAARYLAGEAVRLHTEGRATLDRADDLERAAAEPQPRHTVRGKTSDEGWPYGTTHDVDCPACLASGSSFTSSPRSETYWSS